MDLVDVSRRSDTPPVVGVVGRRTTVPRSEPAVFGTPVVVLVVCSTCRRSGVTVGVDGVRVGVMVRRPSVMPQPSGWTRRPAAASVLVVPSRVVALRRASSETVGDTRRPAVAAVVPLAVGETLRPALVAT